MSLASASTVGKMVRKFIFSNSEKNSKEKLQNYVWFDHTNGPFTGYDGEVR